MKNILKLAAIALIGTGGILGINEFFFAPSAGTIEAPAVAEAPPELAKETPKAEDWEKVLEKKRKEKDAEDRRKLAAEKLFNNLGLEKPKTDPKTGVTPPNMFAKTPEAGGNKPAQAPEGGGGSSGDGSGGGGSTGGGGAAPATGNNTTPVTDPGGEVEPTEEEPTGDYWLDARGERHNKNCQYYKNVQGQASGPEAGTPCDICGG